MTTTSIVIAVLIALVIYNLAFYLLIGIAISLTAGVGLFAGILNKFKRKKRWDDDPVLRKAFNSDEL